MAFDKYQGWKPRFKLVDGRRDADKRAEKETTHVPFDDTRGYEHANDDAGEWLKENE